MDPDGHTRSFCTDTRLHLFRDTDLIMGLSTNLWDDDDGLVSDYCGQSVIVTNTATGKKYVYYQSTLEHRLIALLIALLSITVTIGDNSGQAQYITLSKSAFTALGDANAGEFPASFQFVNFNATLLGSAAGASAPLATVSAARPKPNELSVAKGSSEAAPTTSSSEGRFLPHR